ncbi:hypothetical protein LINPERHAP1_LOCUS24311 [Linum perenne]
MPETLYTKCSPNRIVEVMKGSPSERKLKELRKMRFSGNKTLRLTLMAFALVQFRCMISQSVERVLVQFRCMICVV